jgi:hypothetical protein
MNSFHVSVAGSLSPPDLHDTKEQAYEFFLRTFPDENSYTLEEVRPLVLGDLLPDGALKSIMRERNAELTSDDSLFDSEDFLQHEVEMQKMARNTLNKWAEMRGIVVMGNIVVDSTSVKRS